MQNKNISNSNIISSSCTFSGHFLEVVLHWVALAQISVCFTLKLIKNNNI